MEQSKREEARFETWTEGESHRPCGKNSKGCVFASYGCCNILSKTGWVKTIENVYLTAVKARNNEI